MRDVAAKLWPFMNRYRFGLAAGLIATMLTNLIRMALPEVLQQAIDYLKSNEITDWVGSVGRGWFGLGQTGGVEERRSEVTCQVLPDPGRMRQGGARVCRPPPPQAGNFVRCRQ